MKRLRLLGGSIFVVALLWSVGIIFSTPKAEAATLNVVAGTDAINNSNDVCQLSEAIQNINDQAQTNDDCPAGDGNDDTINLPSGTITLTADLPDITKALIIQGQSTEQTIINGAGEYEVYNVNSVEIGEVIFRQLTIRAYKEFAIGSAESVIKVEEVEIDGTNSIPGDGQGLGGILVAAGSATIDHVYIHDLEGNGLNGLFGISIQTEQNLNVSADISNVSITDLFSSDSLVSGLALASGLFSGTLTPGTIDVSASNMTFDSFSNVTNAVTGVSVIGTVAGGQSNINLELYNSTFNNLEGGVGVLGSSASLATAGVALNESDQVLIDILVKNSILAGEDSCLIFGDAASALGAGVSAGTIVENLSSSGGNISDDTSCADSFTDPTDQNNVDPADLMLGTLSDNGGSVPTIPLLPGSIAIDSGTTVAGLTTDARGITRPQCSAYDSGAYEYNGTCPEPTNNTLTYPDPITSSTVTLELPSDVVNGTVSAISPNTIPKDTFFSFPLGLTSFQFDTTIGATKTITLYYDLPGDPGLYTPRKYNTNTKTFATITNANITRVTYNNKSMLRLTYDITDGGLLDQDNTANGTIVDPVGLAQASVGVPNTGL